MVNVPEIKAYMARRDDMTNKELAAKIGTSPATLARWFESGTCRRLRLKR